MNECDKCGIEDRSEDLVWVSSEDFQPKDGEHVPEWVYGRYDALCEACYQELIELKQA